MYYVDSCIVVSIYVLNMLKSQAGTKPPSEPVRASVFGALVSQTISAQPQRREGRIHGLALPVTSVNPVTSCREHLINGVGSGCQKMSVLSSSSVPLPTHTHPLHLPAPLLAICLHTTCFKMNC